jgi:integrase
VEHTTFIHEPRKLPVVLSPEEVARLFNAAPGLKYKAALSVAYGADLHAAEVVSLKVSDIDSRRMIIRVEQGRPQGPHVMLSASTLGRDGTTANFCVSGQVHISHFTSILSISRLSVRARARRGCAMSLWLKRRDRPNERPQGWTNVA